MGTKKVLVKVHPEGKYGMPGHFHSWRQDTDNFQSLMSPTPSTSANSPSASVSPSSATRTSWKRCSRPPSIPSSPS
jgi:hypothetical protein